VIAIDTNILVRVVVDDPSSPDQVTAARRLVRSHLADTIFVAVPVLLETVWLLQRHFRKSRDVVLATLVAILDQSAFVVADRDAVAVAVESFATSGNTGFADCLIEALARRAGASTTFTFDADAASRPHFTLLTT